MQNQRQLIYRQDSGPGHAWNCKFWEWEGASRERVSGRRQSRSPHSFFGSFPIPIPLCDKAYPSAFRDPSGCRPAEWWHCSDPCCCGRGGRHCSPCRAPDRSPQSTVACNGFESICECPNLKRHKNRKKEARPKSRANGLRSLCSRMSRSSRRWQEHLDEDTDVDMDMDSVHCHASLGVL